MNFIANSLQQPLSVHLIQVSTIAAEIVNQLAVDLNLDIAEQLNNDMLIAAVEIASKCHDLGKLSADFQAYIQKDDAYQADIGEGELFSANNLLHHEISLLIFDAIWPQLKETIEPIAIQQSKKIRQLRNIIRHAIYWHHAEPKREVNTDQILKQYIEAYPNISLFLNHINSMCRELFTGCIIEIEEDDLLDALENFKVPVFFDLSINIQGGYCEWRKAFTKNIDVNAINFLTRFCLIAADRHISKQPIETINAPYPINVFDDQPLLLAIKKYVEQPELAGKRTADQLDAAKTLVNYDSNVVVGAAGCGKTRTALMAYYEARIGAKGQHQGILWICPRIAVALSVLEEIKASLPDAKVALITGELKGVWQGDKLDEDTIPLDADILIVTLDQVAKWLTSNSAQPNFIAFMQRYVVWDEYHELFTIQTLYYISALLMRLKEHQHQSHIFISATPEPLHLRLICKNDASWQYPVVLESFNTKPVHLTFVDKAEYNNPATLYIFNTATKAQDYAKQSWLTGRENISCYHSKFMPADKATLTQAILQQFGKTATDMQATLFAGPIAQASLNISRQFLTTELSSPSNTLQRLGRNNRFAEYDCATVTLLASESEVYEKVRKYSTTGTIKNTGAYKVKFNNGRIQISVHQHYYASYSYAFFAALISHFSEDKTIPKTLTGNSVTTRVNELNRFYLDYHIKEASKDSVLVDETHEFIDDAINCLRQCELFKPVKSTIIRETKQETSISYRGDSLWATMSQVTVSNNSIVIGDLIGLPEDRLHLVALRESDTFDIAVDENLQQTRISEFENLRKNIKYRAKNAGTRTVQHLCMLAHQTQYPLICSISSREDAAGLYYLTALNQQGKALILGYTKLKNGISSLTVSTQSE